MIHAAACYSLVCVCQLLPHSGHVQNYHSQSHCLISFGSMLYQTLHSEEMGENKKDISWVQSQEMVCFHPSRWEWFSPLCRTSPCKRCIWVKPKRKQGNDVETRMRRWRSCPLILWCLGRLTQFSLSFLSIMCALSECVHVSMYCASLRRLWAQQSLNGGVDVSSGCNKGLQVRLAVYEAHRT